MEEQQLCYPGQCKIQQQHNKGSMVPDNLLNNME